jgi:hypothetical protein
MLFAPCAGIRDRVTRPSPETPDVDQKNNAWFGNLDQLDPSSGRSPFENNQDCASKPMQFSQLGRRWVQAAGEYP